MSAIWKSDEGKRAVEARYREILNLWPVPNEQMTLPTRQGDTFVIACGPEGAPAVFLFHGSASSSFMWIREVAEWARHFRVIAIDMIGEPGLSAPSRPSLDSDAHTLWLDDVMAGLSVAHASLVGISLGGWLALDYATRRPGRIDAMALICPAGLGKQRNFLLRTFPFFFLGKWGQARIRAMAMGRAYTATPPAAAPVREFLGLIFRNFRPRRVLIPRASDAALRQLRMPFAVWLGGEDALIDSAGSKQRLEQNVPQAEIHFDPHIGHFIPTPGAEILSFLRRANGV
jgi:pimeloyl-ACP methyl ester carboxylesterase